MFLQLLEQFIRHLASNVRRGLALLFINTPQNLDNAAQMRREGTQTLLDTLLITDIGKDLLKNGNFRALIHRNMQTGLSHQRQQTYSFEGHSFTTSIRASDNHHKEIAPEMEIGRDNFSGQ